MTLATVRDPGSVARTIWLPFQVWVTGTRCTAPVGEADAIHTLTSTAVSFATASALRSLGDRVTMSTAWHGRSRAAIESKVRSLRPHSGGQLSFRYSNFRIHHSARASS